MLCCKCTACQRLLALHHSIATSEHFKYGKECTPAYLPPLQRADMQAACRMRHNVLHEPLLHAMWHIRLKTHAVAATGCQCRLHHSCLVH